MKCKFISSTNSAFEELINKEVDLYYSLVASFTFDTSDVSFDFRHGTARTSIITNIKIEENYRFCYLITITTSNSTYVFQEGSAENLEKKLEPFSKEQKLGLALAFGVF